MLQKEPNLTTRSDRPSRDWSRIAVLALRLALGASVAVPALTSCAGPTDDPKAPTTQITLDLAAFPDVGLDLPSGVDGLTAVVEAVRDDGNWTTVTDRKDLGRVQASDHLVLPWSFSPSAAQVRVSLVARRSLTDETYFEAVWSTADLAIGKKAAARFWAFPPLTWHASTNVDGYGVSSAMVTSLEVNQAADVDLREAPFAVFSATIPPGGLCRVSLPTQNSGWSVFSASGLAKIGTNLYEPPISLPSNFSSSLWGDHPLILVVTRKTSASTSQGTLLVSDATADGQAAARLAIYPRQALRPLEGGRWFMGANEPSDQIFVWEDGQEYPTPGPYFAHPIFEMTPLAGRIAFRSGTQIWTVPSDGSTAAATLVLSDVSEYAGLSSFGPDLLAVSSDRTIQVVDPTAAPGQRIVSSYQIDSGSMRYKVLGQAKAVIYELEGQTYLVSWVDADGTWAAPTLLSAGPNWTYGLQALGPGFWLGRNNLDQLVVYQEAAGTLTLVGPCPVAYPSLVAQGHVITYESWDGKDYLVSRRFPEGGSPTRLGEVPIGWSPRFTGFDSGTVRSLLGSTSQTRVDRISFVVPQEAP